MFEFQFRVKRVSHINRVSSNISPNKFLAVFSVAVIFACTFAFSANFASASDITPQKIIELANSDRSKEGLEILKENEKLDRSAMDKAEDMAQNDYFAHTSPKGLTPWHWIEEEDYDYAYAGENLAMDFNSIEKMNQAWLDSPTHRANILNEKYKDIGVAVREGTINGHSTIIVVQQFGSGDKNEINKAERITREPSIKKETVYPALPMPEEKLESDAAISHSYSPIITSPKNNDVLSSEAIEVVGRSAPGAKITIKDDENIIGQAVSDEKGWFRYEEAMLKEGSHNLRAESEDFSGSAKIMRDSLNKVSISVDRSIPEVKYRIYAAKGAFESEEYFLRVTSSKPNCIFNLGGQMRNIMNRRSAYFSLPKRNLSSVIRIEDQAGNMSAKHITLANYFEGSGEDNLVGRAAQIFTGDNIYADNSGRGSIMKNLGLAIADNN
jgi:uncharacterized protein YkwD